MPDEVNCKISTGATYLGNDKCHFLVWAPLARKVDVHILLPHNQSFSLLERKTGYFEGTIEGIYPGDTYLYRLDEREEYPDPASRYQPHGVLGPSQIVNSFFDWGDDKWHGIHLNEYIIYELHIGSYTFEGTFEAVIPYLEELKELGITAIEIMPVAQFPGSRNWGYDGVYPFAPQNSYGGDIGLKRLVNACHQKGIAAILDVVYNHFGPEGNYFKKYGPYSTTTYKTVWGDAINMDGPQSDEVRRFFIENALYWISDFHFDALRLDAVHAMLDFSPVPFLEQLTLAVHNLSQRLHRNAYVIAESDSNDARLLTPREIGGYGVDAQWSDDFHHSLHTLLTGERSGYYKDFGKVHDLAVAIKDGFVYSGQYSPYRQRSHGSSSKNISVGNLVVCSQNHDQIGNRALGDRLSQIIPLPALKLAAGIVLLSPSIPLLFMGEEYGETSPFPYFISHLDIQLVEAVRSGRKKEFSSFEWITDVPDPFMENTFFSAKLKHYLKDSGEHKILADFYRELIRIRKELLKPSLSGQDNLEVMSFEKPKILYFRRRSEVSEIAAIFSFNENQNTFFFPVPEGKWRKLLDSQDRRWLGQGSAIPKEITSEGGISITLNPLSLVLYHRQND
jgi:maltooligosyltrehalose trehalohydrolase